MPLHCLVGPASRRSGGETGGTRCRCEIETDEPRLSAVKQALDGPRIAAEQRSELARARDPVDVERRGRRERECRAIEIEADLRIDEFWSFAIT